MFLQTGQPAPDFTLFTSDKQPWTLSEQDRPTVLLFFPGAFTSVCTDEMNAVSNALHEYDGLDAQVVGISTDSPAVLAEFKKVNQIRFPLLSDHHAEAARAYGALMSAEQHNLGFDRVARRAAFVVDADGTLLHAEVLENALNHPDFEAIKDALRQPA
jgi:glutaredoxin-dependent peroxiredoxin